MKTTITISKELRTEINKLKYLYGDKTAGQLLWRLIRNINTKKELHTPEQSGVDAFKQSFDNLNLKREERKERNSNNYKNAKEALNRLRSRN